MRRPWRNPVKCRRTDGRVEALSTGSQRTPQAKVKPRKPQVNHSRDVLRWTLARGRLGQQSLRTEGKRVFRRGKRRPSHQGAQEICRATSRIQGLILKDCTSIVPLCIMSEQWEILHNKASHRYKRPERVMIPQHGH